MDDYVIVEAENLGDLSKSVNEWIKKGYNPRGNILYLANMFVQVVISKEI